MYATVVVECESLFLNRGEGLPILARALFELPMPRKRIQKLNSLEHSPATGHSGKEFATKTQPQPSHRPSQKLSDSTIPYDSFRSGQNVLPENGPTAKMMQNYVVPAAGAGGGSRIKAGHTAIQKNDVMRFS